MINNTKQKIRHSKLRNTGILFELLLRQIATDTLNGKDSLATNILKKHFNNSEISKEFKIYNTLASSKNLSEAKASLLINSCVEAHNKLNKNNLRKQKYNLISDIKENYKIDEFFKSKIDNYKILASIYMLFETLQSDSVDETITANYKFTILENISNKKEEEKDAVLEEFSSYDKGTRMLIYKMLLEKFNNKYKDFNQKQKNLLREYINNISTSDRLKEYVNKEMISVSDELKQIISKTDDEVRKVKIQEISSYIKPIESSKTVSDKDINNLLYSYELIQEYEKL